MQRGGGRGEFRGGGRGRGGRVSAGQRPVGEETRIDIAARLAEFQARLCSHLRRAVKSSLFCVNTHTVLCLRRPPPTPPSAFHRV